MMISVVRRKAARSRNPDPGGFSRCSAPAFLQGVPDCNFDRRVVAVLPLEPERLGRMQRGLRHESRDGLT
jgi:hypothetical protein